MSNVAKNFDIWATSSNILCNYFVSFIFFIFDIFI